MGYMSCWCRRFWVLGFCFIQQHHQEDTEAILQSTNETEMSSPLIETTLPNHKVVLHYDDNSTDDRSDASLLQPTSRAPSLFSSRSRASSTTSRSSESSNYPEPSSKTHKKRNDSVERKAKSSSSPERPVRKPVRVSSEVEEPRSLKERLQADLDSGSMSAFSSRKRHH